MGRGRGRRERGDGKTRRAAEEEGRCKMEMAEMASGGAGARLARWQDVRGDDRIVSGSGRAAAHVTSVANRLDRLGRWMDGWSLGIVR